MDHRHLANDLVFHRLSTPMADSIYVYYQEVAVAGAWSYDGGVITPVAPFFNSFVIFRISDITTGVPSEFDYTQLQFQNTTFDEYAYVVPQTGFSSGIIPLMVNDNPRADLILRQAPDTLGEASGEDHDLELAINDNTLTFCMRQEYTKLFLIKLRWIRSIYFEGLQAFALRLGS